MKKRLTSIKFWLGIAQLIAGIIEFISQQPAGAAWGTVAIGIIFVIVGWFGKPDNPSLTPADNARRSWWDRAYAWVWFHVEALWIKSKAARRPFTFMMRDFWHQHKVWGWLIMAVVTGGIWFLLIAAVIWESWWCLGFGLPLVSFHWSLFSHLKWGTPYKPGEQEDPEYTG
jgi:hypothetical protein